MTVKEFRQQWLKSFAAGIDKKALEKHVLSKGNHIWHVFSWELMPKECYLEGKEAREAYNALCKYEKENAIYIEPFEHRDSFSLTWQQACAENLEKHTEIFVAAKHFSWTYIKTHEGDWCGPYFCRKQK